MQRLMRLEDRRWRLTSNSETNRHRSDRILVVQEVLTVQYYLHYVSISGEQLYTRLFSCVLLGSCKYSSLFCCPYHPYHTMPCEQRHTLWTWCYQWRPANNESSATLNFTQPIKQA